MSPLKRCQQTLKFSQLKAKEIIILDLVREVIRDKCDLFEYESNDLIPEPENETIKRVNTFRKYIENILEKKVSQINVVLFLIYIVITDDGHQRFGTTLDNCETRDYFTFSESDDDGVE